MNPTMAAPLGQDAPKLVTLGDRELLKHFAEVVFDCARADVQAGPYLRVRQTVAGKRGDLGLLLSQLALGADVALAGPFPRRPELPPGPLGESVHAHRL